MRLWLALTVLATVAVSGRAFAEDPACVAESNLVKVASAQTVTALTQAAKSLGPDYREQAGYALRAAKLSPRSLDAAERLLKLLPQTDDQQGVWLNISDPTCRESSRNLSILARIADSAPRVVSEAEVVSGHDMDNYVRYIFRISRVTDPIDMDYVATVCRKRHELFIRTVNSLPTRDRNYFVAQIFEPLSCKEIALPEAKD